MTVAVYANLGHLMRLAKAEAKAHKTGNPEDIKRAAEQHQVYQKICADADGVCLGVEVKVLTTKPERIIQ
jgi:hypothetical protein